MTPNEQSRLAHALNDLRPDWPIASLSTFIGRHMTNRTYRDAAVMLVWVACDLDKDGQPATETPKRVLENGPWALAAAAGGTNTLRAHPPRRDQECRIHVGQWADNCAGCKLDDVIPVDDPPSPDLPPVADVNPRLAKRLAEMRSER